MKKNAYRYNSVKNNDVLYKVNLKITKTNSIIFLVASALTYYAYYFFNNYKKILKPNIEANTMIKRIKDYKVLENSTINLIVNCFLLTKEAVIDIYTNLHHSVSDIKKNMSDIDKKYKLRIVLLTNLDKESNSKLIATLNTINSINSVDNNKRSNITDNSETIGQSNIDVTVSNLEKVNVFYLKMKLIELEIKDIYFYARLDTTDFITCLNYISNLNSVYGSNCNVSVENSNIIDEISNSIKDNKDTNKVFKDNCCDSIEKEIKSKISKDNSKNEVNDKDDKSIDSIKNYCDIIEDIKNINANTIELNKNKVTYSPNEVQIKKNQITYSEDVIERINNELQCSQFILSKFAKNYNKSALFNIKHKSFSKSTINKRLNNKGIDQSRLVFNQPINSSFNYTRSTLKDYVNNCRFKIIEKVLFISDYVEQGDIVDHIDNFEFTGYSTIKKQSRIREINKKISDLLVMMIKESILSG